MDTEELAGRIGGWIKKKVKEVGSKGVVLGLSGGIDSAVVAVLCKRAFPESILCINLPCHSNPEDQKHAKLVADKFAIPYKVVNLDKIFDSFLDILPSDVVSPAIDRMSKSNLKVRLRMVTLYYHANRLNYLVVGSSNRSELSVGYFTKWGDGGVDMMPIGRLVKQEVIELATYLGVPKTIIDKPPSAGLWPGQTDESEMGITYEALDRYLLTGKAGMNIKKTIEVLHNRSEHKRKLPPLPPRWKI